jgi:hypothetical protein
MNSAEILLITFGCLTIATFILTGKTIYKKFVPDEDNEADSYEPNIEQYNEVNTQGGTRKKNRKTQGGTRKKNRKTKRRN